MQKSIAVPGDWNVVCQVCRAKIKASQSTTRWDGLVVGKNHDGCFERRHPQDMPTPVVRDERPLPFTSPEGTDTFTTVSYNTSLESVPDGNFKTNNETVE